jgi:hypothetical protein
MPSTQTMKVRAAAHWFLSSCSSRPWGVRWRNCFPERNLSRRVAASSVRRVNHVGRRQSPHQGYAAGHNTRSPIRSGAGASPTSNGCCVTELAQGRSLSRPFPSRATPLALDCLWIALGGAPVAGACHCPAVALWVAIAAVSVHPTDNKRPCARVQRSLRTAAIWRSAVCARHCRLIGR